VSLDLDATGYDHESHVERAVALAREAGDRGDGPYGSVLVRDGDRVAEASNRERTDDDIALHPELTLARRAAREATPDERRRTVMYTSTEPCPMCAGGIAIAGLGAVVYAVSGARAAELRGGRAPPPCETTFDGWGADVAVRGGVRRTEGEAVHREFG
jgi:tRNA(Arg) A34 adenosine deaminase TadA